MEQSKIAKIINNFIIISLISLVIFAWIKKFTNNLILTLILTTMFVTILATELNHFSKKRTNRLNLKKEELEFKNKCINKLYSNTNQTNVTFFKNALKNNFSFTSHKNFLLDKQKSIIIIPFFENDELLPQHLLSFIKKANSHNAKTLIILCNNEAKNLEKLKTSFNLKIIILNNYETFGLLKQLNTYPISKEINLKKEKRKHNLFIKENLINRANAKPLLFCGIMLYISSIYVPYKLYYIITATICLILSAIILIFIKNPKQQNKYETILK